MRIVKHVRAGLELVRLDLYIRYKPAGSRRLYREAARRFVALIDAVSSPVSCSLYDATARLPVVPEDTSSYGDVIRWSWFENLDPDTRTIHSVDYDIPAAALEREVRRMQYNRRKK